MTKIIASLALLSLAACAQPSHLQYDYGRTYSTAFRAQTDLGRPSVAKAAYPLTGDEGIALRKAVVAKTTDEESGTAETTK